MWGVPAGLFFCRNDFAIICDAFSLFVNDLEEGDDDDNDDNNDDPLPPISTRKLQDSPA